MRRGRRARGSRSIGTRTETDGDVSLEGIHRASHATGVREEIAFPKSPSFTQRFIFWKTRSEDAGAAARGRSLELQQAGVYGSTLPVTGLVKRRMVEKGT
jgi:hypothetical protein